MISLGGVILPEDMLLEDLTDKSFFAKTETSITGREIFVLQRLSVGKDLNLVATEESGWLTKQHVDSLYNLASTGQPMELIYYSKSFDVRFRYEEFPYIDIVPLFPVIDTENGYFIGTIKLKEL